jgi:hypothetical protein
MAVYIAINRKADDTAHSTTFSDLRSSFQQQKSPDTLFCPFLPITTPTRTSHASGQSALHRRCLPTLARAELLRSSACCLVHKITSQRRRPQPQIAQPIFDMFQTFSGSSRRPRQVNLSGQNTNPFAASSWTPSASGTQQTVANAQQERLQRQQERERLNASKRIQRTWRGHRVRHDLAESRRVLFDETDVADAGSARAGVGLVQKTRLLIAFFNRRRKDDINRLIDLSERISDFGYGPFLAHQDIERQVAPLSQVTLAALQG